MTNVSGPGKVQVRNFLKAQALRELERLGYKIERIPKAGKASLRRITKDGLSKKVTIRTSQDTWIAFPRNADDSGWSTLEDADLVLAASLTEKGSSRANFHLMDADDIRARFDRALAAKLKADHVVPAERGVWISLYEHEASDPVSRVGAGAGLAHPPIAADVPVVLSGEVAITDPDEDDTEISDPHPQPPPVRRHEQDDVPLTIAEAKRRLARSFGVDPSAIKIVVEG